MAPPIRTLLADDHKIFCDGIANLLTQTTRFEILGTFHDGTVLLQKFGPGMADLIVLDVELPGMNGLDAIKRIRLLDPRIKIVMLTMHEEVTYAGHAYREGANGYLTKTIESSELVNRLLQIMDGVDTGQNAKPAAEENLLSLKENEILRLIAQGKTNLEISDLLCISSLTVKTHRQNIMRKLDVNNTAALIRSSFARGLL